MPQAVDNTEEYVDVVNYLEGYCVEDGKQHTEWPTGFIWFMSPQTMRSCCDAQSRAKVEHKRCNNKNWIKNRFQNELTSKKII